MLRSNGLWSKRGRLISAKHSSQTTNGSYIPEIVKSSNVPAAQRSSLGSFRGVLRLRVLLTATLLIACGSAWAQTTGTLLGVVSDPNGAVIPSATVRVTNTDTGFTANVVSNSEGSYLIPLLPIGHYSIVVEAGGFRTFKESGVVVQIGRASCRERV